MAESTGIALANAETGDLTQTNGGTQEGSNTCVASASAALHGSYGFRFAFAGTDNENHRYIAFTSRTEAYARIYIRPDADFDANTGTGWCLVLRSGTSSRCYPQYTVSGGVITMLRFYYQTDSGSTYTSISQVCSKGEAHYLEIHYKAATSAGANDGVAELWLDGTLIAQVTGIDNDTITFDRLYFGNVGTMVPTNGAILDFDDVKIAESYIGAYADESATSIPVILNHLRNQGVA